MTAQDAAVREPAELDGVTLARLTGAKAVANTALRWIPPFLPTLERAFGVSTTQMTTVIGLGEASGLSTIFVGRHLDRGRERTVMIGALGAVTVSSLIALGGSIWSFAVAFVLLIMGVANYTVSCHALISHRVAYHRRARSIGLFETSWAFALLIGGPLIALLINVFGWRGPFVFLAVATAIAAVVVATTLPSQAIETSLDDAGTSAPNPAPIRTRVRLTRRAWLVVLGSATMAPAGLSVFVVSGSWLDDEFGVSTGGLGFIVMGFGMIELIASTGTAAFADRLGKLRSTLAGVIVLAVGLVVMANASGRLVVGVIGLLLLLLGFEFGFVTSLSLVSEAMPSARGSTLAVSNAVGTLTRGTGTITSGWLYGRYGISGTIGLSATAATIATTCFVLSRFDLSRFDRAR